MPKKITLESFIERANIKHNNKYDYSKVLYTTNHEKVIIICKDESHGYFEFEQRPSGHLVYSNPCEKCLKNKKVNQQYFIDKFKEKHGNKYDYSKVVYEHSKKNVLIICRNEKHGYYEFYQTPNCHLSGCGCSKCLFNSKWTREKLIDKFNQVHGFKYNYSKFKYVNTDTKIIVICKKHGEFEQKPLAHIKGKGCLYCINQKNNSETFSYKAKLVHGEKYDYSLVNFKNLDTKVDILCKKHGIFKQTPSSHLVGSNCPMCKFSRGEEKIKLYLDNNMIEYDYQKVFKNCKGKKKGLLKFDFFIPKYNICIEYDGKQHYSPVTFFGGEADFITRKRNDEIKNKYCDKEGINLIRIPYTEKNIEEILKKNIK